MTITKLRGAEYLLRSVADGLEDYFMGAGEAPGVWHGRWADGLGLSGAVEAEALRALVEGEHPTLGVPLLSGHRERTVRALDLTLSAPKSVSLLWAFGDPATSAEVSIAVSAAAGTAMDFLEAHAAVTRRQVDGVRRRVGTHGFAAAMFTHRTSRAGDPQLHVHCLVPNVVERDDGAHVAIDAAPVHEWLKASGTVFQAELQRQLTDRLGLVWGPERNGCRELVGFHRAQLRAFSKRTVAIEIALEAGLEAVTAKERMRADDRASLATRERKDRMLTPDVLRSRWEDEAARAGIPVGARLLRTMRHQPARDVPVDRSQLFAALIDPEFGLCATTARFGHAHVVERVAALASAVLTAVTATSGAVLWCLGDEDQGRSVAPGGLAAELARLADDRQVTAAELSVNRRQHDPDEQEALAAYRRGDLAASQATRAGHGWEHTASTTEETRDQLAAVAVVDICDHGPTAVAVLAVSHVDCEDLADRIRRQLRALGRITGPELTGPGWGPEERGYAAGDRVLLHVNCRLGDERVHNGTAGQVCAVDRHGIHVTLDDGRTAVLPPAVYAGCRPDGSPNVSHAWARTIDGAQGGTWDHVHLLATPNVDRHTLYVGQSRGRQPTHTWNTVPTPGDEVHGNVVVDRRDPGEIVLAAAARVPDNTFAAWDDPNVIDRRLRAEAHEHRAALASGPPDCRAEQQQLARAVEQLEREARTHADALTRAERHERATGGPHLRRHAREAHHSAVAARDRAEHRLLDTQADLRITRAQLGRAESAVEQRHRWEQANQWRHHELAHIEHQLAAHWTRAVLTAIDQDDPLAHGLDRLRGARRSLVAQDAAADIAMVDDALSEARIDRLYAIDHGQPAPEHLTALLGAVPRDGAARDAWLGLAEQTEARLDRGVPLPAYGRTLSVVERLERLGADDPLQHVRTIIDSAHWLPDAAGIDGPERWRNAADQAAELHHALERSRSRELGHDLGISL